MKTATKLFIVSLLGLALLSSVYLTFAQADNSPVPLTDQVSDGVSHAYHYMYQYMHGNHSGNGPMDGTGNQYQHGAHGQGGQGPYGNQTECPNQ